jgi:hypothetical protein
MEIKLKNTEAQIELLKATASKNRETAYEAKAAIADLVGPVLAQVINNAPTISNFYTTKPFGEDENPSFPLDLLYDISDEDYLQINSQTVAGGLSSNEMFAAHDELKFKTYPIDSAWSYDKKYARRARLDVLSALFTRMAQEVLLKQERTSVNQLCGALVNAGVSGAQVISATTADILTIADFNNLITLSKRIWSSFSKGTPVGGSRVGITDLIMSPEMTEEIRSMAYQPVNTRAGSITTSGATAIAATDEMRNAIMSAAGLSSIFDINCIELLEFGVGQRYNKIFDAVNVANSSPVTFTQASDEILIGLDRSRPNALLRPTVIEEGSATELTVEVDDQFAARSGKAGFYGKLTEGRIITDSRILTGLKV